LVTGVQTCALPIYQHLAADVVFRSDELDMVFLSLMLEADRVPQLGVGLGEEVGGEHRQILPVSLCHDRALPVPMDREKTKRVAEQVFRDMAGAMTAGMVYVGTHTGLFRAMQGKGPMRLEDVARASGLQSRY